MASESERIDRDEVKEGYPMTDPVLTPWGYRARHGALCDVTVNGGVHGCDCELATLDAARKDEPGLREAAQAVLDWYDDPDERQHLRALMPALRAALSTPPTDAGLPCSHIDAAGYPVLEAVDAEVLVDARDTLLAFLRGDAMSSNLRPSSVRGLVRDLDALLGQPPTEFEKENR